MRSSSYNGYDFCQQQYFLTYVLGIQRQSNQKADKGTIVHKVMECLANIKKTLQENPSATSVKDNALGTITFDTKSMLAPYTLSNQEVEAVNKSRVAKTIYKCPCEVKYGHIRYGVDLVERLLKLSYEYYVDKTPHHTWRPADKRDCLNWTWMALDYKNGLFDPRMRNIVASEPHFDITIDREWAEYYYVLPTGEEIFGNLAIKGTIDLITEIEPGVLEIVDWKTGQRLDWANGGAKSYKKLCKDPQLMLYYYAARHLYPDAKDIILTIFFVRDGGPFSVCFDDESIEEFEGLLRKRFNEIRNCKNPKMCSPDQSNFKCNKICDFYKNNWPGTNKNICRFIHDQTKLIGIDEVVKKYTNPNHTIDKYDAPGE